jgi:hypothetical protein
MTPQQMAAAAKLSETPLAAFICPSRRAATTFTRTLVLPVPGGHAWNADPIPKTNRSDYVGIVDPMASAFGIRLANLTLVVLHDRGTNANSRMQLIL